MCKIEKTDKLKANDILLINAPSGLESGDKAQYCRRTCLFWPGDKVKVVLDIQK
ncbi:MAG: hypothetical protein K9M56_00115 [Victivallales bacterium]|nr:hypothetical protein [Victivallales bacterium]